MRPSHNAFKGYSFQKSIYTFLVLRMDINRKIKRVEAEILPENHNFDDVFIESNDNNNYYIQTKNYEEINNIQIKDDGIIINNSFSKKSNKGLNIFIINKIDENYNYDLYKTNTSIFGLDAYEKDKTYLVFTNIDEIWKTIIKSCKNENRIISIFSLADKYSSYNNNFITIDMLPQFNFYSNVLENETVKVRKFKSSFNNKIYAIIGKPGVGKSHLVNELKIDSNYLYRFWISEQDNDKIERLKYTNFIRELGEIIFRDYVIHTEEEIVNKISIEKSTLILDGLDHIENYNEVDINKYIEFIDLFDKSANAKIIVLTRPLKRQIEWENSTLDNWSREEMNLYLEAAYSIKDFLIQKKIYNITKGYPIIVNFIAQHYKMYSEIPEYNEIKEINEYYEKLINNVQIKNLLLIFTTNFNFYCYEEIKDILGYNEFISLKEFIDTYKYLFNIKLNRISLIHDSLNTYLYGLLKNKYLKNKVLNYVKQSINNYELRFLSRIDCFDFDIKYKTEILVKFSKYSVLLKLINSNIDFEAIKIFYYKLSKLLEKCDSDIFDINQYYEYILIHSILTRDNITCRYGLMYQQLKYYRNNKINICHNLYSNGSLFNLYYLLKTKDCKMFKNYSDSLNMDSEREIDEVYYHIDEELDFFDKFSKNIDINAFEKKYIYNNEEIQLERRKQIAFLLANCFINNVNDNEFAKIFNTYLFISEEKAINEMKIKFETLKIDSFMAKWALSEAKNNLFKYGVLDYKNPYKKMSLCKIIDYYAVKGSFTVAETVKDYIRLAIKENRKIDIFSINNYYLMYNNRKDYSVYTLSNALKTFYDLNLIDLNKIIKLISTAQKMSEKGIRTILNDFINLLDDKDIEKLNKIDFFEKSNNYRICINDLNVRIINLLSEKDFIENESIKMQNALRIGYINYNEINNVLNSKYKRKILRFFDHYKIEIHNFPTSKKIDKEYNVICKYIEQDKGEKYIPGDKFKKGILDIRDYNYIKDSNISHIEIAKKLDGWYSKFSEIEIYNIFEKDILRKDILKLIYTTLVNGTTQIDYDGDYYHYLGNIPEFIKNIEYEADWKKMYSIFNEFMKISKIIV